MISKCLVALMLIGVAVSRIAKERFPLMLSHNTGFESSMCDDPKNVKQAESGMKKFFECHLDLLSDYSEEDSYSYNSEHVIEGALYVPFIKHVCDKKDEVMKCYADLIDAIATCANFNSTTTKIDMKNVVDFVCMDDGAITTEFIMDGGIDCMRLKMPRLISCEGTTADISTIMKASPSERCKILRRKSQCAEDIFEDCPKPSTARYFSRLAKIIIHSECEEAGLDV